MTTYNDLPGASGYGLQWGHSRSYSAQLSSGFDAGSGNNWQITEFMHLGLVFDDTTYNKGGLSSHLFRNAAETLHYDKTMSGYDSVFQTKETMAYASGWTYYHKQLDGSATEYSGLNGMFLFHSDAQGNVITVTDWAKNGFHPTTVQRTCVTPTGTVKEQYDYTYDFPASRSANVTSVTLSRVTSTGKVNVSRATYTYYDGQLETATTLIWQNGGWASRGTCYYRYWGQPIRSSSSSSSSSLNSSSSSGTPVSSGGLLKFIVEPGSYERLSAVADPLTAPDSLLMQFADNYYEYQDKKVTKEVVNSGSLTYLLSYSNSTFTDDYNHWATKTTETLPDGSKNIVYSNYAGQTMLQVFESGENQWSTFTRYDSDGRAIWFADPAAVSGFDEGLADLLGYNSGSQTYAYLRDHAGLITRVTYHEPSSYQNSESIQEGQLGTLIKLNELEYCCVGTDCECAGSSSSSSSARSSSSSSSAGPHLLGSTGVCGSGVWMISKETVYPSADDQTQTQVTTYCRSFYSGAYATKEQIITFPVVSTDQNGSGVATSRRDYFDQFGNATWSMDERGYLTRRTFDIPTGALVEQVDDANAATYSDAPPGWTTPAGGGLNIVTQYQVDGLGRTTLAAGPGFVDASGRTVYTAVWTVYDDQKHITLSAAGYSGPATSPTLVNPVSIIKSDAGGRVNEQIQAVSTLTNGSLPAVMAAYALDSRCGTDPSFGTPPLCGFPQSSYSRWTTFQYTDCCLLASQRVYHTIPTTGEGTSGTNYDETEYGYDVMKRRNRTVTPGGTITDLVFDPRGLVTGSYVGTNDAGATENDPTGGGSNPANNMVIVTGSEYDDGLDGGDGNLTTSTLYVNSTTTRVTAMTYDFRNRNVTTDGEIDYFQKVYYDNLSRVIKSERYDTTAAGHLIARSETKFDNLGRAYQSITYGVDPTTGTVGNSLVNNTWYDQSGNVIKSLPAGSSLFVKTAYDGLGRLTTQYQGYDLDETSYNEAFTVTDDVIMSQSETTYDAASHSIQVTARQRYHDAPDTQKGALKDPSTTPKARVTYAAMYYDGVGRAVATANYGTNGGTALTRPSSVPAASDNVLVGLTSYDSTGVVLDVTDPAGIVTRTEYDDAGRTIATIENYRSTSSSSSSSSSAGGSGCASSDDTNRTTLFSYTPDGQQATMTAVNSSTTNQTTTWTYGTTLANSDVATSILLRSITYPDSVSGSDVVYYTANRQAERTSLTDQRGCVHQYEYDKLGRPIHDRVTTVGSGVDSAVLRLSSSYDVRGMLAKLTSWNNASVSSGNAVNDVQWTYNNFGQSIKTYQSHSGQVNTSTTANVQMGYANGSTNTIRPTTLTYPNGRVVTYSYGTSGSITDSSAQVASLIDSNVGATHLADYSYLGLGSVVQQDSPEASLRYTLISLTGTNDPDTGDIYAGLDRFGRVKDSRWRNTSSSTDLSRVQYGYNRDSSRTWRANPTDPNQHYDWLYGYDGLQRLKNGDRGTLNGTKTAITNEQFAQCWTLDSTGNWKEFRQDNDGNGIWDLVQSRAANPVNEITGITNSVGSAWVNPAYDPAGNMTTVPQPADPTKGYTAVYDAWNRLVSLSDSTSHNTVQQNVYDGRNYRIIRKDYTSGTLSATRNFYYTDGWQDVEERLGTSPDSASPDQQYVWGVRYIDDILCRNRSVSGTLDERLYGCQDANWNVAAIVDSSAAVQERYEYDPYGNTTVLAPTFTVRSSSSFAWDLTYAGYRFERGSGLFNARYRFYDASLGTWINRDPAGYHDSTNLYAATFVVNGYDPYGLGDESQITFFQMYSEMVTSQAIDLFYPTYLQFLPNSPNSMRAKAVVDRIANNVLPELEAQNASWYYKAYVVVGDALGGLTGVKGIPDSLEGKTENGRCYSTGAHIFVIGTTSVQLLGTGLGLKGNLGKGVGPNIPLPKIPDWIFLDPPDSRSLVLPDSHRLNLQPPIKLQRGTSFYDALDTASNLQIDIERLARYQYGRGSSYDFGPGYYLTAPGSEVSLKFAGQNGFGGGGGPALLNVSMSASALDVLLRRFPRARHNVPITGMPGTQTFFPPESLPMVNRFGRFACETIVREE